MNLRLTILAGGVAAALAGGVALVGCGGGGGDGPTGNSTVVGNVNSVVGAGVFYQPAEPRGLAGLLAGLRDALVGKAWAAVAGVSIRVAGTDLEATTADDGSFIISGVPAGEQTLIFSYGGTTASLAITVPDNATVRLTDVDVFNGSVDVNNVQVEVNPDDSSSSNANGNDNSGNDNGGNDNGDDDNGNDDHGGDDNGNDNHDDNGNDNGDDDDNDNGTL